MISHHHTHTNTAAATNLQLSASLAQEIFPPFASQSAGGGEDFRTPKYPQKPRKKRTKLIRIDSPNGASSSSASGVVPAKPKSGKKPDPSAPKITEPCSECGRKFWSVKALFGHMRCHPERQWRGINPPPNFRRSAQAKNEAETELTEEDHEVAACLLMLARTPNTFTNNNSSAIANNAGASSDCSPLETESMVREVDCRFECSSCKKVFGSHQALGGHRASHKNVKGCFAITRSDSTEEELVVENHNNVVGGGGGGEELMRRGDNEEEEEDMMMVMSGGHKCGICLRVFSSGQALGGHKRCHWERGDEPPQRVEEGGGGGGGLDLNLPAPVEHDPFPSYSSALALDLRLGI